MFTLSPGPSQISPETKEDIKRAIADGVLELSHRSTRFTEISRLAIEELRAYLRVPEDYRIFYFDSASHVWHSLVANLVDEKSFHFINGAFSSKAKDASLSLGKTAISMDATWGEQCDFSKSDIPQDVELITTCYNETSTGVKMTSSDIAAISTKAPHAMLAIDITSSGGGIPVTIASADIWYFSVQKCFGLPAGLGIAIISPRAYERSVEFSKNAMNLAGIWAWENLDEMMSGGLYQTPQTPNVLNIYLLGKQCERWNKDGGIERRKEEILNKKSLMEEWMLERNRCAWFVQDTMHRSDTVFVVGAAQDDVSAARELLRQKGIELGAGYGKIKKDTFRIANFPAITEEMLLEALDILSLHFAT